MADDGENFWRKPVTESDLAFEAEECGPKKR